jgi:hypothetical protein
MDPQSKKYLDDDIRKLELLGEKNNVKMTLDKRCLLTFNRFMHLFIMITRHSKEQFIKEQRKCRKERRRAFKLKDWKVYG